MALPVPYTGAPVRPVRRRFKVHGLLWAALVSGALWCVALALFGVI